MERQDITKLLESINGLTKKSDKELADSVLEVSVQANKQVIEEFVGDDGMSQALIEIMEPQLLLREKAGLRKGIQGTVDVLRDLRHGDMEIKEIIKKKYNLSNDEAEEYL